METRNYSNNEINAGIYVRVSTEDQAREGHSLEQQKKICRDYCISKGYSEYSVYEDAGISGKNTNRPEFQRLLGDVRSRKIDVVIAIKQDRISRDVMDSYEFSNVLMKHDCKLELALESVDLESADGKLVFGLMAVFSEHERRKISERTKMGMVGALENGNIPGPVTLGYKKDKDNPEKLLRKRLVIDEQNSVIIKEIFMLCADGLSFHHISNLMIQKYPDVTKWKDSAISRIINNKMYYGVYEHGKRENKTITEYHDIVPPIITKELFEECQKSIKQNKRNYYRVYDYKFLKKLVCPCHSNSDHGTRKRMAGHSTKNRYGQTYLYYTCPHCGKYINEADIENLLLYKLDDLWQFHNLISNHTHAFQLELKQIDKLKLQADLDALLATMKTSDYYDSKNLNFLMLSDTERRLFIDKYIDSIQLCINQYGNLDIESIMYKPHMIRIVDNLKKNGFIGDIRGERYERKVYQTMSQKDFDYLLAELENKFDVYVDEVKPMFPFAEFLDSSLLKVVKIKPRKSIFKPKFKYIYLTENETQLC